MIASEDRRFRSHFGLDLRGNLRAIVTNVRQLLRTNRVEQAVFDARKDRYGVPWVVELTGVIGHYGMITGLLNAFEMMPAPDAEQLPV